MGDLLKFDDSRAHDFQRTSIRSINERDLLEMPAYDIGCGKSSGLPFDYLMTDIYSGCLPIKSICYGNCSAADYWINKGHNFGLRRLNHFDEGVFRQAISLLPPNQRWLRQGWVSDVSLSKKGWEVLADAAEILMESGVRLVIITKIFTRPSTLILKRLERTRAEIRVSVSAIDTKQEIERRFGFLDTFRQVNGFSVPYLMSFLYGDPLLKNNQELIVEKIVLDDYVAAEHPLRLNSDNTGLNNAAGTSSHLHPKFSDQTWFGRLYTAVPQFVLPPPTFLPPEYDFYFLRYSSYVQSGVQYPFNNLPTYQDLIEKNLIHRNTFDHANYDVK